MTHVTEREILSLLKQTVAQAAEDCEGLAKLPLRGPTYKRLRERLKTIENCCRQVAYYRDGDARWLQVGLAMAKAHRLAGDWLRGHYPRPLFMGLATNLRALGYSAHQLETQATGRMGAILPVPVRTIRTESRPVQVITPGGIIVPEGVALH